jgi:hypothetical protein
MSSTHAEPAPPRSVIRPLAGPAAVLVAVLSLWVGDAKAQERFDLSVGYNYTRTRFTDDSFTSTRRWGVSGGYRFTDTAELELAFTEVIDRNVLVGLEDTTFHDRIYSLNYVQTLVPRRFALQPYVKVGVGQLNRDAEGTYFGGGQPPASVGAVTGVLAAGTRVYFTRRFAVRIEGTSYLQGGSIRTWRDNFALTFGTSLSL